MTTTRQPENDGTTITAPGSGTSLAAGLSGHHNSLGILRLVFASGVIFSHAFYIIGDDHDPLLGLVRGQESIGGIAVLGFFAISGYLITKSGMTTDALQFIWRRALRILPAFWTVLLVSALAVGPVVWSIMGRPLSTYFSAAPGGPLSYVLANAGLKINQFGIHDVFVDTPYGSYAGSVINGSLWTLTYEWGAYLIIWGLVILGLLRFGTIVVPIITGFYLALEIAFRVMPFELWQQIPYYSDHYRVSLPLIFLYGACLAVYAKRVPSDWRIAALALVLVVTSLVFGGFTLVGYPALTYLVLWLAAALPARLHVIGAKNDYSYGVYIYGFLVQQFTAFLGWTQWGYLLWTLACLVITGALAWLSWHGVEKWAMRLKDWGPGKGIRHWWERRPRRRPTSVPEST